ncbi:nuclear nucleic acid-binding protein C1D [Stomoxys calcitrans]|uniref:Nuclear nucleic acid-binding protein C1D n=1 Tax=Stomoxys calcitrans TaxID=35570 RepID=A0A1I8PLW8_STOCA|nr:nuclear nucleic acid-binding protein C1D [Stomoxys calcitrans]
MTSGARDYGELRNDEKFINCVENFDESLDKIEASIQTAIGFKDYEELSTQERVKLDNYLAYSINSLYWMYVKLQGLDPNEHGIKNELSRTRQTILRDKEIYERNTIRPKLDKGAAGRFIKHGLHLRYDKEGNPINDKGEHSNRDEPMEN